MAAGLLSLDIGNFRNIKDARLSFSPAINLITGANAAGKTSLLEAIYCLGRVRSFRTTDANHLVQTGQSAYRLLGRIGSTGRRMVPIGLERCQGRYRIHLDGRNVLRLSDLAGCFPVQIMSGDTPNLLNGGPGYRRQSLDWALFHVEQGYREIWQRYTRTVRQRNAALRAHAPKTQIIAWDGELVDAAEKLDRVRHHYLSSLEPYVQKELGNLLPGRMLSLRYLAGWPKELSLQAALSKTLEKDLALGYTHYGPHRADIVLLMDGSSVRSNFSRGQYKAIHLGYLMGQVKMQYGLNVRGGAFLLDDLGSELDAVHQSRILDCLKDIGTQVFVTAIDTHAVNLTAWSEMKRFHVEHGVIQEVL
jgi:DNA replication and repair protein RecF